MRRSLLLVPLLLVACNNKQVAESNAAATASLVEAEKVSVTKNEAWRKRIIAARQEAVPRPDLGKCTVPVTKESLTLLHTDEFLRDAGVSTSPPSSTGVYQAADLEK